VKAKDIPSQDTDQASSVAVQAALAAEKAAAADTARAAADTARGAAVGAISGAGLARSRGRAGAREKKSGPPPDGYICDRCASRSSNSLFSL